MSWIWYAGGVLVQISLYTSCIAISIFVLNLLKFWLRAKFWTNMYKGREDMSGKTVLITGASSGLGEFVAMDMARRNARVILACRNVEKAKRVAREITEATGNPNIVVKYLDLCSFESVRKCAQDILDTEDQLHVLINNAGIAYNDGPPLTEDGIEVTMQANSLGHFLFTLLLLGLLRKSAPSRIINVASVLYITASLNYHNLDFSRYRGYTEKDKYGNSNLVRIAITRQLAKRLSATGVTVNSLHPGIVKTTIFGSNPRGIRKFIKFLARFAGVTIEQGSQTIIKLAVDPSLENVSGEYFANCEKEAVNKKAQDDQLGRRIFEVSEEAVGETFLQRTG